MEFFIVARSFAAPFVSDTSESFIDAETPKNALEKFAADYKHPCGLYFAACWASANDYHKSKDALAEWRSNHLRAMDRESAKTKGGYSYLGHGPGEFEIDGKHTKVADPKAGSVTK